MPCSRGDLSLYALYPFLAQISSDLYFQSRRVMGGGGVRRFGGVVMVCSMERTLTQPRSALDSGEGWYSLHGSHDNLTSPPLDLGQ